MLIDRLMPEFDATRIEHRVVAARVSDAYAAAVGIDFVDTVRESHALRGLFALRAGTERIASVLRRSGSTVTAGGPEALRLTDLPEHGEWVRLGEQPPNEIAFGAIGRFWAGETGWVQIDASDFASFARAGYAKIAGNFSFRDYGETRTLVSYEVRTRATDAVSRRAFWRYWRVASPFVGRVMRAQLAIVEREAARSITSSFV
jgi:hypothetical protein